MGHKITAQKSKMILVIGTVVLLLAVLFIVFMPHKLVKDAVSIHYIRINHCGEDIHLEHKHEEKLKQVLSSIYCRRIYGYHPRSIDGDILSLDFMADGKPVHMYFGEYNFAYHSAGIMREYIILDYQTVYDNIMKVLYPHLHA